MSLKPTVTQLFQDEHEEGSLSAAALQALTVDADIGAKIQAGLGIDPDDVPASEVVLVTMMPDDSGSIRFSGNAELVRQGHNLVLDSLRASQQKNDILVHNRYLNGSVLYPYRPLDDAVEMTSKNYDPNQDTPLYDQTVVLLGTVLAKAREFEDNGVPCRTVTLLLTDGGDTSSRHQNPKSVRAVVEDLLRRETHIVAAMGIDDGCTDFKQVFKSMGIPDQWILTTANSDKEIRKAFQVFSQSAVRASQSAGAFQQTMAGGFTS